MLQGTVPNLTPETFRDALFACRRHHRRASASHTSSYGDKGYWGGVPDYQGVDDATVFWWDPAATGPDEIRKEGTGHVPVRRRWHSATCPAQWPPRRSCSTPTVPSPIYDTPPPGEERGDYPSPAG